MSQVYYCPNEGDRQKAVMDAAKLQMRCAELEIERDKLKLEFEACEDSRRIMIEAKGFIVAGPSDDMSEVGRLVNENVALKEEVAQLKAIIAEIAP